MSNLNPFLFALAVSVALLAVVFALPAETQEKVKSEGALVEMSAALTFLATSIVLVFKRAWAIWPFIALPALFCLREFDMDKVPFTEGLLKSRQYIGDTVPLAERLLSIVVLVAVLVVVVTCIKRGTGPFLRGVRAGHPLALCVALALFLGVTAKAVDGMERKLAPYGISVSADTVNKATIYEETAELGMALTLVIAALSWPTQTRPRDYI